MGLVVSVVPAGAKVHLWRIDTMWRTSATAPRGRDVVCFVVLVVVARRDLHALGAGVASGPLLFHVQPPSMGARLGAAAHYSRNRGPVPRAQRSQLIRSGEMAWNAARDGRRSSQSGWSVDSTSPIVIAMTNSPGVADCVINLSGTFAGDLHGLLHDAAAQGPLAVDEMTGATVVLRHRDLETLARDPRLVGIGLTLFDLMQITEGPLRDWYGKLMFTTEGEYHRRIRTVVARAFTPRSVTALRPPNCSGAM